MAKKKLFDDLKEAILDVLLNADRLNSDEYAISRNALYVLQSEYNIHFVEPHEKQLDCITK